MEKIDIVADQLQLDRALNKLIHNLVEESQLTLGETLSAGSSVKNSACSNSWH